MEEIYQILFGIVILFAGYFLGNFLSKITEEELKEGKEWFKIIVIISLFAAIISLILRNDVLFFSFLFIAIVTSRSLKN